jgi:hypothetical protein
VGLIDIWRGHHLGVHRLPTRWASITGSSTDAYIGGNAVTDPAEIARRTEESKQRAFFAT